MAASEVRAAWQRASNRCFVQEDAKRVPNLTSCQSSKLVDGSDHASHKSSISNAMIGSRWWLQLQPNCGFQNSLTYEQLNALENEVEILKVSNKNETCKGDATNFGDENHVSSYYVSSMEGMQEAYSKNSQTCPQLVDMMTKHETVEIDSVGCSLFKQTNDFSLDLNYSRIEAEKKAQPWWQTADRDELVCFVSNKSLNHFENCDLPPPQKYLRGKPCANINGGKIKTASFDWEAKSGAFSNLTLEAKGSLESELMHRKPGPSSNKGHLCYDSDKPSSYPTIHKGVTEQGIEGDPRKGQLLEALCHSQTRAREANEVAKQIYAEKEHIIALLFIQASQLFAYKQWFQLLQLETLSNHNKNKDQPISTLFPMTLPWMSFEGMKDGKIKQKFGIAKQKMVEKQKSDIARYAVAFALGWSLVGTGLLLGWTVGWMLPDF